MKRESGAPGTPNGCQAYIRCQWFFWKVHDPTTAISKQRSEGRFVQRELPAKTGRTHYSAQALRRVLPRLYGSPGGASASASKPSERPYEGMSPPTPASSSPNFPNLSADERIIALNSPGAKPSLCRIFRATLIIARLDRLSRNVGMIARLMESGLEFVAADYPHANRFTIHILAAVAEYESRLNSERMKEAIAARRERGAVTAPSTYKDFRRFPPGCQRASAIVRKARSEARARDLAPLVR